MNTLYFNSNVDGSGDDGNWNTVLNWWLDSDWTIPAGILPSDGDIVYIDSNMGTPPTSPVSLADFIVSSFQGGTTIEVDSNTTVSSAEFYQDCIVQGQLYCEDRAIITFNDAATLQANIWANEFDPTTKTHVFFYGESLVGNSLTIQGDIDFYDDSYNQGVLSLGNIDTYISFHGFSNNSNASSINNGYIINFYNNSQQNGFLSASNNINFYDTSAATSASVIFDGGTTTFYDQSSCQDGIVGNIIIIKCVTATIIELEDSSTNPFSFSRSPVLVGVNGSSLMGIF